MFNIQQISFTEVQALTFDCIIAASGFESRASYQTQRMLPAELQYVLAFENEKDDPVRQQNDKKFSELGFKPLSISSNENYVASIEKMFEDIDKAFANKPTVNVYVDYSSMSRNIYAYLLSTFHYKKLEKKNINVFFGYAHSLYLKNNGDHTLNRIVEPLEGYCNVSIPQKPTALIICLGNELQRAFGLKEYFDAETYFFYSDATFNEGYSKEVEEVNSELLVSTKQDHIIKFPVYDLMYTDYLLNNLCSVLLKKYRIVIALCGPKPFTLLSFINCLCLGESVEVWRISAGTAMAKVDRQANGTVNVLKMTF